MKKRKWKNVKGYKGLYKITDTGEVYSTKTKRYLKQFVRKGKRRYCLVNLACSRVHKSHYVHRLVAEAFIPNPENKLCVNHLDGNGSNNNYLNLEWVTYKENNQYTSKIGRISCGEDRHNHKATEKTVRLIRKLYDNGTPAKTIAIKVGLHPVTVRGIAKRKHWKHVT